MADELTVVQTLAQPFWVSRSISLCFARMGIPMLSACAFLRASGQNPPGLMHRNEVPIVQAVERRGPLVIDGLLDDVAWRVAPVASDFRQQDPSPGQPATQRTEVRFLYDEAALYIGARMHDTRGAAGVSMRVVRRDESPSSDYFMLILDTFHDHMSRTVFEVTPSGAKLDSRGVGTANPDASWDAVWTVMTRVDSDGWTAEIRIPFSQLRFPRDSVQTWGMQLWRHSQRLNETSQWAFWTKSQAGGPAFFGHLTSVRPPMSSHPTELLPYVLMSRATTPKLGAAPVTRGAGGDFSTLLTPNLSLNATINPDFGQVEADPAVLNLTTVETLYPEKRPFFVEGAGQFNFGSISCFTCAGSMSPGLFYSRRIGRAPQYTPPGQVLRLPSGTRILGAAKLLGQTADGFSLGVFDAATAQANAISLGDSGRQLSTPTEPTTNYFAARAKWNVNGPNGVIGGMLTSVDRSLSTSALESFLLRHAMAAGADLDWWWGSHTYHLQSSLAASYVAGDSAAMLRVESSSTHYLQRPDRHAPTTGFFANALDSSATRLAGYSTYARVAKDAGNWMWEGVVTGRNPGFEVNDLGYQPTSDAVLALANLERSFTVPTRYYQSIALVAGVQEEANFGGDVVKGRQSVGGLTATMRNLWTFVAVHAQSGTALDDRLTRGGPVVATAAMRSDSISLMTDTRGEVSASAGLSTSHQADGGSGYQVSTGLTLRPAANLALMLTPTVARSTNEAQYVTSAADPTALLFYGRRYVFATLAQRTIALATSVDIIMSPTLSVSIYAQPFLASGSFSTFKEYAAPRSLRRLEYGRDIGAISRTDTTGYASYTVDPDGAGAARPFTFVDPNFTLRSLRDNLVLRWEYHPGCILYVAWSQMGQNSAGYGDVQVSRDAPALFRGPMNRTLMIKASYWFTS